MSQRIITEGYLKRFLLIILGMFIFFSLMSALVLYKNLHLPLFNHHYGAIHAMVTQIKESLIIKTIEINLFFFLLTTIGMILLGILYSHRIVGPLFRVKKFSAVLGEGRFDERISFRKKDAIHTLSSELNEMAQGCQDKVTLLTSGLRELEDTVTLLASVPDKSKKSDDLLKKLQKLDERMSEDCQKIRL